MPIDIHTEVVQLWEGSRLISWNSATSALGALCVRR